MIVSLQVVLALTVLLSQGSQAWMITTPRNVVGTTTITTATTITATRRKPHKSILMMAMENNNNNEEDDDDDDKSNDNKEDEIIHGYKLTTKSKKTLVFDQKTGRFFEKTTASTEIFNEESNNFFFDIPSKDNAEVKKQQIMIAASFSNEMVPTKILFGKASQEEMNEWLEQQQQKKQQQQQQQQRQQQQAPPKNQSFSKFSTAEMNYNTKDSSSPTTTNIIRETSIVEKCFEAWNERDLNKMVNCFSDDNTFEYRDSQYLGAFTNKQDLLKHYSQTMNLVPSDSRIVVENIAVCPNTGNIGAQWHLERKKDGSIIPFTRGCSFYTTKNGRITSGFKVSEMLVKPNKQYADRLVSSASRLLQNTRRGSSSSSSSQKRSPASVPSSSSTSSIIEKYFDAWNRRDMEAALECFVDDCSYQTEDPVFVDTFQGKAALREHLVKNAASLPESCRIVLDKIAVDPQNGNIGTMWHLEVNGIQIPNLRGCSMYTTTAATKSLSSSSSGGVLLKSGFDVTEAPVKLPREATAFLSLPARILLGGSR